MRCCSSVPDSRTGLWWASTSGPVPVATRSCCDECSPTGRGSWPPIEATPCSPAAGVRGAAGTRAALRGRAAPLGGWVGRLRDQPSTRCITSISSGSPDEVARVLRPGGDLFVYTRTPEQNAKSIWGRAFPGFVSHESRLHDEATLERVFGDLGAVEMTSFIFARYATAARLAERVRGGAYSTFRRYRPDELEEALDLLPRTPRRRRRGVARPQPARACATAALSAASGAADLSSLLACIRKGDMDLKSEICSGPRLRPRACGRAELHVGGSLAGRAKGGLRCADFGASVLVWSCLAWSVCCQVWLPSRRQLPATATTVRTTIWRWVIRYLSGSIRCSPSRESIPTSSWAIRSWRPTCSAPGRSCPMPAARARPVPV